MTRDHHTPDVRPLVPAPWLDAFVVALRMRDVSGRRIGEAIAEVEQFCADSGTAAEEAFGAPAEYAAHLTEATGDPTSSSSDVRTALSRGAALLGFVLVIAALPAAIDGAATVSITLGWFLAVPGVLAGSVLVLRVAAGDVVHAAQDDAAGARRRRWRAWAVTALTFVALTALVLVLTQPVAEIPTWLALAVGAVLLIGDAIVGTLHVRRAPAADLVVDPRIAHDDQVADMERRRRTALRFEILTAWIMPLFAVVGSVLLVGLSALG
ncbi:hypothetical protein [Cellulomonas sp. URHE0023]|uniref:hypothetical protein n=1 Tax=Cellulomonas sp. URHE0023 TaxID=1380354 RepID=UPI0004898BE5|nr:hypothetical protein [Cellulomonas sp. URHE0023]